MDLSKLEMLESRVGRLLDRLSEVSAGAAELERQLSDTREDLEEAQARIAVLEEERRIVLERVDGLLSRLE